MGKPSAPPPPDYAGAATAQGAANVDAARVSGRMQNPNIYTPYGNQVVTWGPNDQATVTRTLSPEQQALLNGQNALSMGLLGTAQSGLNRVDQMMNSNYNPNVPGLQFGANQVPLATGVNANNIQSDYDPGGQIQRNLGIDDYSKNRDQVTEAYMSRIRPEFDRQEEATRNRLMNQGIMPGNEASNADLDTLGRARNDATQQAYLAGGQEQSRMHGLALQGGQFANQAQAQANSQSANAANFYNSAQAAQFAQGMQNAGLYNQGQQGIFGNQMSNAGFNNQAVAQGIQQYLTQRQLPLNEINALRTGSQVNNPQFQNYQGASTQAGNFQQAAQQQGTWDMNRYNQNVGTYNNFMGGLMGMGSAAMGPSDSRLKSNIERVGTHKLGIGVYDYDIGGVRARGVMADEVLHVKPEAVTDHGVLFVDYGVLDA